MASKQVVGVVGLGHVGLPLAVEAAQSGYKVIGYDTNLDVVNNVNTGKSHVQDVSDESLCGVLEDFYASTNTAWLKRCDAIILCVPTPLDDHKEPNLSYIESAGRVVAGVLEEGQLVVLESTTYPGTTRDVLLPILEESGLKGGADFHLCYSPERVDPGNRTWHTRNTPKVLGGLTNTCLTVGSALYETIFDEVVPVSSPEVAELTKVYENTFRMVNIALANELAQACQVLDLDVWEVLDACETKPFGFMRFSPGPGVGGHCIPLDPFYLVWKLLQEGHELPLIQAAAVVNEGMPYWWIRLLSTRLGRLEGKRVLVLGVAYKKGVNDVRESPALDVITALRGAEAEVSFYDPFVSELDGLHSVELSEKTLRDVDAAIIVTDHPDVDYGLVSKYVDVVVDTRGVLGSQ